jgi:hypothetical protein
MKTEIHHQNPEAFVSNLSQITEGGLIRSRIYRLYLRDMVSSRSMRKEPSLSKNEIDMVKKRLKSLGYL